MTETAPKTPAFWQRGWFAVLMFGTITAGLIVFGYLRLIPETWFRDFVAEINVRATVVEGVPSGSAFPTMKHRPDPDHPYICFAAFPPLDWDRLYVVPPPTDVEADPLYRTLDWSLGDWGKFIEATKIDDSQVLFVLSQDDVVVSVHAFYNVWGNALALVTDDGIAAADAVFTAESVGVQFNLALADQVPEGICP